MRMPLSSKALFIPSVDRAVISGPVPGLSRWMELTAVYPARSLSRNALAPRDRQSLVSSIIAAASAILNPERTR